MNANVESLSSNFAIPGHLSFRETQSGLRVADIQTSHASASVALQGAQVLTWQPVGQQPVIWVSKAAIFAPGKPVRGGVPVCWPWFGPLGDKGAHGFVRTRAWQVRASQLDSAGQVVLRLGIGDDADTRALWDQPFDLELVVTVGATLTMALTSHNTGATPMAVTEALHTYFCVGNIAQTSVTGLDGCGYIDKVQNFSQHTQSGEVRFSGETDRVYTPTSAECLITDAAWGRNIHIAKQGSIATVVWNPWVEREKAFADMATGEYQDMLCVETANAPEPVTLAPGERHTLVAVISVR